MADRIATRAAYGKALADLGEKYDFYVVDADLSGSTQTAVFGKKFFGRALDAHAQLAHLARKMHQARAVAEIILDLARDRRRDEGGKFQPLALVEAVDPADERQRSDLIQVVVIHPPPDELLREHGGYVQIFLHDLVAQGNVMRLAVSAEQFFLVHAC